MLSFNRKQNKAWTPSDLYTRDAQTDDEDYVIIEYSSPQPEDLDQFVKQASKIKASSNMSTMNWYFKNFSQAQSFQRWCSRTLQIEVPTVHTTTVNVIIYASTRYQIMLPLAQHQTLFERYQRFDKPLSDHLIKRIQHCLRRENWTEAWRIARAYQASIDSRQLARLSFRYHHNMVNTLLSYLLHDGHALSTDHQKAIIEACCGILNQSHKSQQILAKVMTMKYGLDFTPLHYMVGRQSGEVVQQCMEMLSQSEKGRQIMERIATMKNDQHWTPLHILIHQQPSSTFQYYVATLSETKEGRQALIQAATIKHDGGWTSIHQMMRDQSSSAVQHYLSILSKMDEGCRALVEAVALEDAWHWTPLHQMVCNQSSTVVQQYLSILSRTQKGLQMLALAVTKRINGECTPLHIMMRHQSNEAVSQCINALQQTADGKRALRATLTLQSEGYRTLGHLLLRYQSTQVVHQYIKALHDTQHGLHALKQVLFLVSQRNKRPVDHLVRYHSLEDCQTHWPNAVWSALTSSFDPAYSANQSILAHAAHYQNVSGMAVLLNTMTTVPEDLSIIVDAQRDLVRQLINPKLWRQLTNDHKVQQLCHTLAEKTAFRQQVCQDYLVGKKLDTKLIKIVNQAIAQQATLTPSEQAFKQARAMDNWFTKSHAALAYQAKLPGLFQPLTTMNAFNQHLNWILLASRMPEQVNARQKYYQRAHSDIQPVIADIWHKRRYLNQLSGPCQADVHLTQSEQQALKIFHSGQALVKIIRPQHFDDFQKQLTDLNYRPGSVRLPVNDPSYKFVHFEHSIVPFDTNHKQRDKAPYQYTKKTSMTLISPELTTPVFGMHDQQRELVGLHFDARQVRCKAYLLEDSGTVGHQWYGNWHDVKDYRQKMNTINIQSFNDFCTKFQNNGGRYHNEILAKVNLEALQSVVIARDTEQGRQIAQQWADELSQAAQRPIPIVFYDPIKQQVSPYTLIQQQLDQQKINQRNASLD